VTISTETLTENPILVSKTIEVEGEKIGYLFYNSFVSDFDDELNAAFAEFKSKNVGSLILDLRYNGGGSVRSATRLASMISGQFEGEIFAKQQWNDTYQNLFLDQDPDRLFNRFTDQIGGNPINSLELSNLYVIMASGTASASELVINGLNPYINVTTIGDESVGKSQASVTLYDSEGFGKEGANPEHKYAIQPLVYESVNSNDVGVPYSGLTPDVEIIEDIENLGVLGEISDPLLAAAIEAIKGMNKRFYPQPASWYKEFKESDAGSPIYQKMYIDELPEAFKKKASIFKK
jgi:C-terminal processing protease CtpA/Prc